MIDLVADTGGHSIYFTPGRTTGAPWREVLELFKQAVRSERCLCRKRGVHLAIEPSCVPTRHSSIRFETHPMSPSTPVSSSLWISATCGWSAMHAEVLKHAAPHIALIQICDVIIGGGGKPPPVGACISAKGITIRRLMQEVLDAGYKGVFDLEVLVL